MQLEELIRGTRVRSLIKRLANTALPRNGLIRANEHSDAALSSIRRWTSRDVVLDVGANDGRTALRIQERLNSPVYLAFEPVSSTFRTLRERTGHLDNVRCFRRALGAEPGRRTMYLSAIHEMNSFSEQWGEPVDTEEVDVTTVDEVMAELGLDIIHYLKIDTEGHDLEVLKGARNALESSRVSILQVEVGVDQLEKPQPSLEDVRRHLAPMGYRLYGIYNQCRRPADAPASWNSDEARGYNPAFLSYFDALFVSVAQH